MWLFLLLAFCALVTASIGIILPWSGVGLFVSFGLLTNPEDIPLIFTELWGQLFLPLRLCAIASAALWGAVVLAAIALNLCCRGSLPLPKQRAVRLITLLVSGAIITGLVTIAIFSLLSLTPPGLYGAPWGAGAILFASSVACGFFTLCTGASVTSSARAPIAHPPPPPALPMARLAKVGELDALPRWQEQSIMART